MFRVIQLLVFVFSRIVHRNISIRPNSLKPLFGTSLLLTLGQCCYWGGQLILSYNITNICASYSVWD